MRVTSLVKVARGVVWGVTLALFANRGAYAQEAAPSQPAPPPGYCPVSVRVDPLKGGDNEVVFSLWADDRAAKATGTLVVYAGNQRYRIPFAGAVAADNRNTTVLPTPIVVRFATATRVDSAYVASLNDAGCLVRNPFVRSELQGYTQAPGPGDGSVYPTWSQAWKIFLELAAAAPALPAPSAETVGAPACAQPYATVSATRPAQAVTPHQNSYDGPVVLTLAIDTDGSLLRFRVDKSSHLPWIDAAAVDAAERSRFAPQIYRCIPITGALLFSVRFAPITR